MGSLILCDHRFDQESTVTPAAGLPPSWCGSPSQSGTAVGGGHLRRKELDCGSRSVFSRAAPPHRTLFDEGDARYLCLSVLLSVQELRVCLSLRGAAGAVEGWVLSL